MFLGGIDVVFCGAENDDDVRLRFNRRLRKDFTARALHPTTVRWPSANLMPRAGLCALADTVAVDMRAGQNVRDYRPFNSANTF
jgi:hypothetical protein